MIIRWAIKMFCNSTIKKNASSANYRSFFNKVSAKFNAFVEFLCQTVYALKIKFFCIFSNCASIIAFIIIIITTCYGASQPVLSSALEQYSVYIIQYSLHVHESQSGEVNKYVFSWRQKTSWESIQISENHFLNRGQPEDETSDFETHNSHWELGQDCMQVI